MTPTRKDPYAVLDAAMLEEDLQRNVLALAKALGWRYYHTWNSKRSVAGFPDLMLLRGPRQVVVELKRESRTLDAAQEAWLNAFKATGAEVYVWRPSDQRTGVTQTVLT